MFEKFILHDAHDARRFDTSIADIYLFFYLFIITHSNIFHAIAYIIYILKILNLILTLEKIYFFLIFVYNYFKCISSRCN